MTFSWITLFIQITGIAICGILFSLISIAFKAKNDYSGFVRDADGTYSLSKLQAVVWAVIIISLQISVIICALNNKAANFSDFKLVFSRNTLILLGLSLGSYVTVKGITTNQASSPKTSINSNANSWSAIISDANGLDFSKFQMLIWTLIAALDFFAISHNYLYGILTDKLGIALYFNPDSGTLPYSLPTVESTFLVLMGISQGAYVAKKLVPVDGAKTPSDDPNANRAVEIKKLSILMDNKKDQIDLLTSKGNDATESEKFQLLNSKMEMIDLTAKLEKLIKVPWGD